MSFLPLQANWYSEQFGEALDSLTCYGMELFEEDIDEVIFATNDFLTGGTFIGPGGPFWYILQMSMCLGALFAIIMAGGQAYKMLAKGEPFEVLKILRVLAIGLVMCWWYPPSATTIGGGRGDNCILNVLAFIPNCIGSWAKDLYTAEAIQVQSQFDRLTPMYNLRDMYGDSITASIKVADETINNVVTTTTVTEVSQPDKVVDEQVAAKKLAVKDTFAGFICGFDKLLMFLALVLYRIGWWATIYCQQILLGMLTIFGPIQWAFSILPKWEGAWAKWIIRYLTVHFYGAMLYFVGFRIFVSYCVSVTSNFVFLKRNKPAPKLC